MAQKTGKKRQTKPSQTLGKQPGRQNKMKSRPKSSDASYKGSGKLQDKVAIITGGDSGIGRSVALFFAKEGADVAIVYLNEHKDAETTKKLVEKEGRKCLLIAGDLKKSSFCKKAVEKAVKTFGKLDILVNNAAMQIPRKSILQIKEKDLENTFKTNIFSFFFMVQAALKYLKPGSAIINTTSVTAYRGSAQLLDYSSTKGAIVSFTRSLSANLAGKKIRVNGVAPGPIWTPLIPSTFKGEKVSTFGSDTPLNRPGEPEEVAPSFVFLASDDSSYMTGQILHPNGGEIING